MEVSSQIKECLQDTLIHRTERFQAMLNLPWFGVGRSWVGLGQVGLGLNKLSSLTRKDNWKWFFQEVNVHALQAQVNPVCCIF